MNDFDLESKLKTVRVPERDEDYWEAFPRLVMAKSRATPARTVRQSWLHHFAWEGSIAFACLVAVLGFVLAFGHPKKSVTYAMLTNVKSFQAELVQFQGRVRVLMQIDHGLHSLIEDQP